MVEQTLLADPASDEKYIPIHAPNFEPTKAEIFMSDSKGQTQRLIFTGLPLTEKEQTEWDKFLDHCGKNNLTIPEQYKQNDRMLLRYLQACRFDYTKAHAAIMTHDKWVVETKPHQMPGDWAMPMLNSGFVYISKRDKMLRPVIVVNVAILKTFTAQQTELIAPLVSYMMTYAVNKISLPGKAETFMIIIDLINCSMTQMPITALRKFLGAV